MIKVLIQENDFDLNKAHHQLILDNQKDGAVVTFIGLVRDFTNNDSAPVSALELEHYPGMTEKLLLAIAKQAKKRWYLGRILLIHRVGYLAKNEKIVFVGVTSQHRQASFDGAQFIMDALKNQATFWKKEITEKGAVWVDFKQSDQEAMQRW